MTCVNQIGIWKRGAAGSGRPATAESGTSDNVLVAGVKDHRSHAAWAGLSEFSRGTPAATRCPEVACSSRRRRQNDACLQVNGVSHAVIQLPPVSLVPLHHRSSGANTLYPAGPPQSRPTIAEAVPPAQTG